MSNCVLVTGGAGYIGSHVVRQLGEAGRRVVVLDNLSTGRRNAVLHGELVVGDVGDQALVGELLETHRVDAIMHFAALTVVPESVAQPLRYYQNNTAATRNLLECAERAGVRRFIFSSTAAVYGIPEASLAGEDTPTAPINPYGSSKLMSEWMLRDLARASELRYVILRYFNVAGADPETRIGESTPQATRLVKVACETAVGKRDALYVYGTDYPTADGTGVRDYIHVEDLAAAHLSALAHLEAGGASDTFNCGYGHGYSVREVIDSVRRVSGRELAVHEVERRPGDPPALVAAVDRIRRTLDWTPRYDDLEHIVRTAYAWEQKLAEEQSTAS